MKTVYTKKELAKAIKSGEKHILCKGSVAETLWSIINAKEKLTSTGIAITITITLAELALLLGFAIVLYAIYKNRKVKIQGNKDGSVVVDME